MLAHRRILMTRALAYPNDEHGSLMVHDMAAVLPDATCYYVTEEMTGIAKYAARTMPDQPLRLDDAPTRSGFMLWDAPVSQHEYADATVPIHGIVWNFRHEEDVQVWDGPEADLDGPPTYLRTYDELNLYPLILHRNALMPCAEHGMQWEVGETPDLIANDDDAPGLGKALLATWTLMGQSLTQTVPTRSDRAERRRSARADLPTDLLVVRLRRLSSTPLTEDDREECDYSHRWMVSGHWRNQWLPSRAAHRLQWIAAHVKGPADKPLMIKEKVIAWIR